jgi:uncharacterized protein YjdB
VDATPGQPGYAHTQNGYSTTAAQSFFKGLLAKGAKFDGAGFSLYGGRSSANILNMAEMLNADPALRYLDYVNVEAAASFTKYKATWIGDNVITPQSQYYRTSVNGVYNWLLDYMQAPLDVPNPYGQTRGFYYWEIDWIPINGIGSKQGVPVDVSTRTMFNNGDPAVTQSGLSQAGKAGDVIDGINAYLMRGVAKDKPASMQTPLNEPGVHAPYAVSITAPTGISLANGDLDLAVGDTQRLQPTIAPADRVLTDANIEYSSAAPAVATVNASGFVHAVGIGSTTITATVAGGHAARVTVTVAAPTNATIGDLVVSVGGSPVADGQTLPVKALDALEFTTTLAASTTDRMLTFTSSNPDIASFFGETWQTPDGQLRAYSGTGNAVRLDVHDAGTTDVTIATADGGTTLTLHLTATKVPVTGIALDKQTASVSIGGTVALTATILPANTTRYRVAFTSADTSVATVDSTGVVTGVANGQTTITAVSDDDPTVTATATVTVSGVKATGVTLDASAFRLQTGATRVLHATIAPTNTSDISLQWTSSDPRVATVAPDGTVTAVAPGTADITATTRDGSALTATARVTVQTDPLPVTALTLDTTSYAFRSDFFADESTGASAPTKALTLAVAPADATNADIVWASDTPQVATVSPTGVITAVAPGVARISASTRDGSVTTFATVSVPVLSESFEARAATYPWGTTQTSSIPTMTARVATGNGGKALVFASKSGSGASALQKAFAPVTNKQVVVDFSFNTGAPGSANGAYLAVTDSLKNRYLTLKTTNGGELAFGNGGLLDAANASAAVTGLTPVGSGFNANGAWYTVHSIIDFETKTVTFTVTAKSNPALTATHTLPFDPATTYTGDVSRFQLWTTGSGAGIWYPTLDDVNVYATAPIARQVSVDVPSVRLIPVTGTLGVSRQLGATVLPATAPQGVTWTSSTPSAVTVSSTGLVSAVRTYDSIGDIVPAAADITATATGTGVKTIVRVVITSTANASEQFSVIDGDGETVYPADGNLGMTTGAIRTFIANPTGGDGSTDIARIEWTSSDTSVISLTSVPRSPAGITVTALKKGSATVSVKVYIYSTDVPLTAQIPILVDGGAPVATVPAPPAAPSIGVSDDKVNVSWAPPADGGTAITGYTVTLTPAAGPAITKQAAATAKTIAFTGITPGTWRATVTATNSVGASPASADSLPATVTAAKPVPLSVSAKAQCINGHAHIAVYALNTGKTAADIRFTVGTATEKFTSIAPGKALYKLFDTGSANTPAGSASVVGYSYVAGVGYYATFSAAHAAITCG